MDTLSDVLNLMHLRGCVYFLRNFAAPWGMEMPDGPYAQFHMVVRGRCWLRFEDITVGLAGGDVVVFPGGEGHVLLDDPNTVPVPGMTVLKAHAARQPIFVGGGERARLLCGHFEFDRSFRHPLVEELPRLIHIKGLSAEQPGWFEAVTHMLIRETGADEPGATTVVDRLAEVLFIQVLRAYLLRSRPVRGFLAAVRDEQINRALKAIHAAAGSELTLVDIARQAGMSRSNLARRFKEILGETPINYLTRWRMLKARELLRISGRSLSDIAESVGYGSEAAFSRAFKRQFKQSPGVFRRPAVATYASPSSG